MRTAKADLAAFRRLCVEYGEARAKYERDDAHATYRAEWRKECDRLWAKVQTTEADLTRWLW